MSEPTPAQKKKSLELAERGFSLVREGDYKAALKVAKQLEKLRYTAAYDIAAQAHAGLGDLDEAVSTLERGLQKAPDCWLNWQLLGNYRSDQGDYDAAVAAYERALTCPDVCEDSIRLNQAILANRRRDYAAAEACLRRVTDPEFRLEVATTRVRALEGTGRLDDAMLLAEQTLAGEWEGETAARNLPYVVAALARMRLLRGIDPGEVRGFILGSLEQCPDTQELFWV